MGDFSGGWVGRGEGCSLWQGLTPQWGAGGGWGGGSSESSPVGALLLGVVVGVVVALIGRAWVAWVRKLQGWVKMGGPK